MSFGVLKSSFLALVLAATGVASAAPLLSITKNYGSSHGTTLAAGSCDTLNAGSVTIRDTSSGCARFSDVFDFSSLNYQSIDSFSLTLNFGGTNGRTNILGFSIPNEMWFVRPAAGNTGSPLAYLLHPLTDAASATQVFNFNALSLFDTFNGIVSQGKFGLWFAEETPGADSFNLVSATLTVNGAAAVPEPTGLALTGVALAALALSRRRRARA